MLLYDMKKALLDAFNSANAIVPPLAVTDVNFTNISLIIQNECNSRVTIQTLPTCLTWSGSKQIYYTRRNIATALADVVLPRALGPYTDTDKVCKVLWDVYGISAYHEDFLTATYPVGATSIQLSVQLNALVWLPGEVVTLQIVD